MKRTAETWEPPEYVEMVACPVCGALRGHLCDAPGGIAHTERTHATLESVAVSQTDDNA